VNAEGVWIVVLMVGWVISLAGWRVSIRTSKRLRDQLAQVKETRGLGQQRQDHLSEQLNASRQEVLRLLARIHELEDTVVVQAEIRLSQDLLVHSKDATALLRLTTNEAVGRVTEKVRRKVVVDRFTDRLLEHEVFRARVVLKDLMEEAAGE